MLAGQSAVACSLGGGTSLWMRGMSGYNNKLLTHPLPPYSVRASRRARRAQLKVTPHGRVEVVIPKGFNEKAVAAFVMQHRDWLHRTLWRVEQQRSIDPDLSAEVPRRLKLLALDSSWEVLYRETRKAVALTELSAPNKRLLVCAADEAGSRELLGSWLTQTAKTRLLPWLEQLSQEWGLTYSSSRVRCQKTRWGSCSAKGTININRNLLFLPPPLVRHLFIHELCHTRFLNHSSQYWSLVATIEPDYRRLEAELRGASRYVPLWAFPG